MILLNSFLKLSAEWRRIFPQQRTWMLAQRNAMGILMPEGRKTMTATFCSLGREQKDWSADYKLFSRSNWNAQKLFDPVIQQTLQFSSQKDFIPIAYDDTSIKRQGKKIPFRQCMRDPLSPPFHINFYYGLRFAQASILVPEENEDGIKTTRALPIRFKHVPAVKKPGKRATEEEKEAYKEAKKQTNLSTYFVETIKDLRHQYNELGVRDKKLLIAVDNSYCNRICMRVQIPGVEIIARARKDAKLCFAASQGGRRLYSEKKFTPEQARLDETIPYKEIKVNIGGQSRKIRYKQLLPVLWQRGTKTMSLRLIVLAPTPYRNSPHGKVFYREPAYLFCTDMECSIELLIQTYCNRFQIEVNHRDEKTEMGLGHAQVWAAKSVVRQPVFVAAAYSLLLLASIQCFSGKRIEEVFGKLPKWRKGSNRVSCRDILRVIRSEVHQENHLLENFDIFLHQKTLKNIA